MNNILQNFIQYTHDITSGGSPSMSRMYYEKPLNLRTTLHITLIKIQKLSILQAQNYIFLF